MCRLTRCARSSGTDEKRERSPQRGQKYGISEEEDMTVGGGGRQSIG